MDFNIENFPSDLPACADRPSWSSDRRASRTGPRLLRHPRIAETTKTIDYLRKLHPRQLIIISHRGQPKGRIRRYSLRPIWKALKVRYPKLQFVETPGDIGEAALILVENIRFFKGETENSRDFGRMLAEKADVFVNEAFPVSHRKNASVAQVPKFLPSFAGLRFEKEVKELSRLFSPRRPYIALLGGAKISTKLALLRDLLRRADTVLLGGALVNTLLSAAGFSVGRSFVEKNVKGLNFLLSSKKIITPIDFYALSGDKKVRRILGAVHNADTLYDLGPVTMEKFLNVLSNAKTVVWNGPVGFFEDRRFSQGTDMVADYLAGLKRAFRVAGGGETLLELEKLALSNKFDFVSTGGGAMLEFLAGKKLPGIEALHLIRKY